MKLTEGTPYIITDVPDIESFRSTVDKLGTWGGNKCNARLASYTFPIYLQFIYGKPGQGWDSMSELINYGDETVITYTDFIKKQSQPNLDFTLYPY